MKKNLRPWVLAAAVAAAFVFSSCAYDPYYTSVGGSYTSGYGQGYGYGGSNFSTSLFVSTGDPRWGYDPSCYSYYDYRSRRYYDPYLYGYYPVGYRPQVVIGTPHPYGWRPGRSYCPPPRTVRNVAVVNYRNRESAYRSSNYGWAKQVRSQPAPQMQTRNQSQTRSNYGNPSNFDRNYSSDRSAYSSRTSPYRSQSPQSNWSPSDNRRSSGEYSPSTRSRGSQQQQPQPSSRTQRGNGLPSNYNTPVADTQPRQNQSRGQDTRMRSRPVPQAPQPTESRSRGGSQPSQPTYQRGGGNFNRGDLKLDPDKAKGMRSLGQG
jgi:hypothetical protein